MIHQNTISSRGLNYADCEGSLRVQHGLKGLLYQATATVDSRFWKRLSGPVVAAASALTTVITNITYLFETIIKGLYNLAKGNGRLACKQLCDRLPDAIVRLAFTPFYLIASVALTTLGMLVAPDRYCHNRLREHAVAIGEGDKVNKNFDDHMEKVHEDRAKAESVRAQKAAEKARLKAYKKQTAQASSGSSHQTFVPMSATGTDGGNV